MVERRELITICRQIGTMMEVGVDFLRITRALRDQTDNPRLLELYDQLDHDMKMGENLADAISKSPDVFSPFAVSLVRQGEARGDIEGAWHRLADFLKQEAQEDKDLGLDGQVIGAGYIPTGGLPSNGLEVVAPRSPVTVGMLTDLLERVEGAALRGLTWVAAFLLSLAVVWWSVEFGIIQARWMVGIQLCVAAMFLGIAGSWLRLRREKNRKKQPICSFCGKPESTEVTLQRSSRLAGAAICPTCAAAVAGVAAEIPGKAQPENRQEVPTANAAAGSPIEETTEQDELEAFEKLLLEKGRYREPEGFTPSPSHEITDEVTEDDRFQL